jgi:hypothetical protein
MSDSANDVPPPPGSASEVSNGDAEEPHLETGQRMQVHGSHLDHLSAIAASQDKMLTGAGRELGGLGIYNSGNVAGAPKRTADGEMKQVRGSMSPVKGHSRNTSTMSAVSTVSMASTTTSTIGDVSLHQPLHESARKWLSNTRP